MAQRRWASVEISYMAKASAQADLLADTHVGPEHLLLALVAPEETSVAASALRQSGAEYEALLAFAERARTGIPRPHGRNRARGKGMSPSWYTLEGRADAFAVSFSAAKVQAEHLLLALLWQQNGPHNRLLKGVGVNRRSVYRQLKKLGAAVPTTPPPADDDTRWGDFVTVRVPRGHAWELASFVRKQLPEGAPIGFNFNQTHAWFHTGEGIDLLPLVRRARRQQLAHRKRSTPATPPGRTGDTQAS
jgi:ATP-dependent Clp protease ATP-binding subunit ClpA